MKKSMEKSTKALLIGITSVVLCLVCVMLVLINKSAQDWQQGIYLYDSDISVSAYVQSASFDVCAIVVGEEYFNELKNGTIICELKNENTIIESKYQILYYAQNSHYYEVILRVAPTLSVGNYQFDEIALSKNNTSIGSFDAAISMNIISDSNISDDVAVELVFFSRNELNCELIYRVINNSGKSIDITDLSGGMGKSSFPSITVVNDIDTDQVDIDFNLEEVFVMPLHISAGKNAYVRYSFSLNEENGNTNMIFYPSMTYKNTVSQESHELVLQSACDTPMIAKTADEVLKYISQQR
jgi:hypothetical protein